MTKPKPKHETQGGYHPMAVPEPTSLERLEALEIRMKELERWKDAVDKFIVHVARDHSYQIGGGT